MNPKRHYTHFHIGTCSHYGCVNHVKKGCWLDLLEIHKYVNQVENLHNPQICKARKQGDLHKTENMLYE